MSMETSNKKSMPKATQEWHLVTNHLNLLYMLAAGLVMEPSGFRGKHYIDSLSAFPGWIPLFRNTIPAMALEQAVSERRHLRPCIVSFDLSGVSGPVQVLSRKGKIRNTHFPKARFGKEDAGILVRAPLPLTLLARICFRSPEDKQAFEIAANDVSNVDISPYQIEVGESLFSGATDAAWPPIQTSKPQRRNTRNKVPDNRQGNLLAILEEMPQTPEGKTTLPSIPVQALGGVLAMLYHGASRSELGVNVFQWITNSTHDADGASIEDPILAEVSNWLHGNEISECAGMPAKLYWGAINALVATQEENNSSQPVNIILKYLDDQLAQSTEERIKPRLGRLIADMRSCLGLGSGTITELFERNEGSLSRSMLLFCLREHCVDLLEFSHPLLSDAEYLLASILFGVRDGWLQLPGLLRNPTLSAYVMYRMAGAAHKRQGSNVELPEQPTIPQPLRTFFPSHTDAWSNKEKNAAIEIAKDSKWRDCIETVIASADGSPLDNPRQDNGQFIFSGEAAAITKIQHEAFLQHLGKWPPIDAQLEIRARKMLDEV